MPSYHEKAKEVSKQLHTRGSQVSLSENSFVATADVSPLEYEELLQRPKQLIPASCYCVGEGSIGRSCTYVKSRLVPAMSLSKAWTPLRWSHCSTALPLDTLQRYSFHAFHLDHAFALRAGIDEVVDNTLAYAAAVHERYSGFLAKR